MVFQDFYPRGIGFGFVPHPILVTYYDRDQEMYEMPASKFEYSCVGHKNTIFFSLLLFRIFGDMMLTTSSSSSLLLFFLRRHKSRVIQIL